MKFIAINWLGAIWVVGALILFFVWAMHNKKQALGKFVQAKLLPELISKVNFKFQVLKFSIIAIAIIFSILALMRPQWGFNLQEVKRKGLDILIAIDTSKSMLAEDVLPNRLARSKLAVKDLIKKLKGDRIGLIAFSGTAFLQCPLTADYSGFALSLADLTTDIIPKGGTSISSAIKVALEGYDGQEGGNKALIIITDGEDHEGDPVKLAKELKAKGIKIFCIGIGTNQGELIQLTVSQGNKSFLKDKSGNVVKSRLNESILQTIALTTGGIYVRSSGAKFGLDLIYDEKFSKMEKKETGSKMSKVYYERFQIPLAIALMLLILELFISDKKSI